MDKFDLKKYIAEGKLLKKEISENEEYKPFVKGKTFLIKEELVKVTKTYAFEIENEEEYNFLLNEGADEYYIKHELWDKEEKSKIDEEEFGSTLKEEYFVEDRSGNTTPIDENQIKEDRRPIARGFSKYPEYDENNNIFIERHEVLEKRDTYGALVETKEEYDTIIKYGVYEYEDQHNPDWEFDDEVLKDLDLDEYTLHIDGEKFNINK